MIVKLCRPCSRRVSHRGLAEIAGFDMEITRLYVKGMQAGIIKRNILTIQSEDKLTNIQTMLKASSPSSLTRTNVEEVEEVVLIKSPINNIDFSYN